MDPSVLKTFMSFPHVHFLLPESVTYSKSSLERAKLIIEEKPTFVCFVYILKNTAVWEEKSLVKFIMNMFIIHFFYVYVSIFTLKKKSAK